jgi:ABC-type sugar transport system ATPase subunit
MLAISLRDISHQYTAGNDVLRNLSLEIDPGEFLALVGPSGSGKTTLIRLIAGLERPTSGEIWFGDGNTTRNVTAIAPHLRSVAMVFQDQALVGEQRVRDQIDTRSGFGWFGANKTASSDFDSVCERLGLMTFLTRRVNELSGGERQRVALARALLRRPKVLLLDEPLAHVDVKAKEEFRGYLSDWRRENKATVIAVTHDHAEALAWGQRVAVIDGGELRQAGTPEEVYNQPSDQWVARFIGEPGMNVLDGKVEVAENGDWRFESTEGWCFSGTKETKPHSEPGPISLGFRAEQAEVASNGTEPDGSTGKVIRKEFGGRSTCVWLASCRRKGDDRGAAIAVLTTDHAIPAETERQIVLKPQGICWFDTITGKKNGRSK